MATNYCTVDDIIHAFRPLSLEEQERAEYLIPTVCAELRQYAKRRGKDLDSLIANDEDYGLVVKAVTVDTVGRVLNQSTTDEAFSQMSQSAGGYSISGTLLTPGGGTLILKRDLKRLGLSAQVFKGVDLYGVHQRD